MGKHSSGNLSYWEARRRRRDLRKKAKPRKQPTVLKKRWIIVAFILGLLVGGALGFYAKTIGKFAARLYLSFKEGQWQPDAREKVEVDKSLSVISGDPNKSVNTLILGSDRGSNKGETGWCRSDVMMLVCLHERDKKAVVISIPRDTRVTLPGHGTEKINAAHALGGPSSAIDVVKSLLGVDVHHYISMDFEGFKKIVNAVGGVPVHLSRPIRDPHAGYLPAGDLLLDGEQALVVVRSRKLPGGDLDRIRSQHAFLRALINKVHSTKSVWKAKQIVDILASSCKMDYTAGEIMKLVEELRAFPVQRVQFVTIPGVPKNIAGASYYVPDMEKLAELVEEVKKNTEVSDTLLASIKASSLGSTVVEELYSPTADVIKVLGSGKNSGFAVSIVAEKLRLLGHEKVSEGFAKYPVTSTTIYHRREAKRAGEGVKSSLPELTGAELVLSDEITSEHNSPIVVVLRQGFVPENLVSFYGRLSRPALEIGEISKKRRTIE